MSPSSRLGRTSWTSVLWADLLYAAVYVALGKISLATAYVQTNTATVWIPAGYAVALCLVNGRARWGAVALGSFLLNATVNLAAANEPVASALAVAAAIALGNAGEAALGAWIARRFASGPAFLARSRSFVLFALLVVPIPPLVSMVVGVTASRLGGLTPLDPLPDVMLTWYVANAVGILVFTGAAVLVLTRTTIPRGTGRPLEALLLGLCLLVVSPAICGVYLGQWLQGWPKAYMVIPFLFWASYRFGTTGALTSIILVTLISVVGTMRGFEVFPATSPARALLYLQIFLAMAAVMAFALSASLTENRDLQATLEARVRARTQDVELYLREREAFTSLVAHDLQSPLFGVRNALWAASAAVRGGHLTPAELVEALAVMDETCFTLAGRVAGLLAPGPALPLDTHPPVALDTLLRNIATAHRLRMTGRAATLVVRGDTTVSIRRPQQIEHILDILIDNAIKYSPPAAPIEVRAHRAGETIEISVTDRGRGVPADKVGSLFLARVGGPVQTDDQPGAGLGLYLASEQVGRLGGSLRFEPAHPTGSCFTLTCPV